MSKSSNYTSCPECNGSGDVSSCCGEATIFIEGEIICTQCDKPCNSKTCTQCNGDGGWDTYTEDEHAQHLGIGS